MEKHLNTTTLQSQAESQGFSQSAIAAQLGVTRASVSKWFTGKSFPRPAELLKLGRLLKLRHNELVARDSAGLAPLVAFRKRASCKTTEQHFERARDMGRFLKPLVPYLDNIDVFLGPPSLKNPSNDYRYIQELAARIRRDVDIAENAPFEFSDLIQLFHEHQAMIIPTLWGHKTKHENALHIHLPESQTTWVYLNLDVEIHDFKFWMAHELGHVLTIDLLHKEEIETAEDFADAFAGALLFPEPLAKSALAEYQKKRSPNSRLEVLANWAEKHTISPYSVYKEMEKYARASEIAFTPIESNSLGIFVTQFNKGYQTLSEALFDGKTPTADHFMRVVQEQFDTKVYRALSDYVRDKNPGASTLATILGVNPMDAKAYLEAFKG